MFRHAAYCGLYCGACCSMVVNEKQKGGDTALQVLTDEKEQPCEGCDAIYQEKCEFVQCCRQHEVESCAFCNEFPCEMIIKFSKEEWEHHQVVLDNLKRIKEIGIDAWLAEQKEYWKCPSCQSRTIWYQKQCTHCGSEIKNYM